MPGLGEHRRSALVSHFGSVANLKEASIDELTAVPGIGVATARAVLSALRVDSGAAGSDIDNDQKTDEVGESDQKTDDVGESRTADQG